MRWRRSTPDGRSIDASCWRRTRISAASWRRSSPAHDQVERMAAPLREATRKPLEGKTSVHSWGVSDQPAGGVHEFLEQEEAKQEYCFFTKLSLMIRIGPGRSKVRAGSAKENQRTTRRGKFAL
jgi:hypothetical protein